MTQVCFYFFISKDILLEKISKQNLSIRKQIFVNSSFFTFSSWSINSLTPVRNMRTLRLRQLLSCYFDDTFYFKDILESIWISYLSVWIRWKINQYFEISNGICIQNTQNMHSNLLLCLNWWHQCTSFFTLIISKLVSVHVASIRRLKNFIRIYWINNV